MYVAECEVSVEQGCLGACVAKLQENGHHERAEYYVPPLEKNSQIITE